MHGASEELSELAQRADAQGIYPTRGGSAIRTKASRVHSTEGPAELPGLIAARDGDSTAQVIISNHHININAIFLPPKKKNC